MILRGCRDKEEPDVSRKQSGRAKEGFAKIVWALLAGKTKAIWSCDAGVLGCH
jgi:hypothetical protein